MEPRKTRRGNTEDRCQEEAQEDEQNGSGLDLLSLDRYQRHRRQPGIWRKESEDRLSVYPAYDQLSGRKIYRNVKVRGFAETKCKLDPHTGEILCRHERSAPKNLDCRQPWCLYARKMRERIADRQIRKLRALLGSK